MANAHQVIEELRVPTRSLRKAAPEAWAGFAHLHDAAVADGARAQRFLAVRETVGGTPARCAETGSRPRQSTRATVQAAG